jgi:hydrogenase maturation protein HypF
LAASRFRVEIRGAVQGVGFRPTVYRYAREASLAGFVTNDSSGVVIEVEGSAAACQGFLKRLEEEPPPASVIREFESVGVPAVGETDFVIRPSAGGSEAYISIPPDLNVCADCLREMSTPSDRRHRYPFTNCTNCGPRFTITRAMPYDRPQTTMSPFQLCPECEAEYRDPLDRRFHAQPVACPRCGPKVWLTGGDAGEREQQGEAAIAAARELLAAGRVLAIRGLGGFHLACDATNAEAVSLLRERKKRPAKPFALMCPDLAAAEELVELTAREREMLTSAYRPIVLAAARDVDLREEVAPGNARLGVMLPYTPLHFLLLGPDGSGEPPAGFKALVMTSGNRRDEPICRSNGEALRRLANVADAWLLHDREIHNRADDSIVMVAGGNQRVVRRARGFVPRPIRIARAGGPTILGVGAEMKGGFCLLRGEQAYMSQYLGELEESGNVEFYREALARFVDLLGEPPSVLVHDMHPDYFTSLLARTWPGELPAARSLPPAERTLAVQHHHAHALSVLAELGEQAPERSLGVILDGVGWGADGTAWGGEFLLLERGGAEWRRAAHLQPLRLIGADIAVREPWRQALAAVWQACERHVPKFLRARFEEAAGGEAELQTVEIMLERGLNSPLSSGAGRLFDAVGSLITGRARISFEAQAAMEVEALASRCPGGVEPYQFEIRQPLGNVPLRVDPAPAVRQLLAELEAGRAPEEMAGAFQAGLARSCAEVASRIAAEKRLEAVVLSGGCFQNALLLERVGAELEERGMRWYANREVPVNDGGVALGQALAATLRGDPD